MVHRSLPGGAVTAASHGATTDEQRRGTPRLRHVLLVARGAALRAVAVGRAPAVRGDRVRYGFVWYRDGTRVRTTEVQEDHGAGHDALQRAQLRPGASYWVVVTARNRRGAGQALMSPRLSWSEPRPQPPERAP